MSWADGEFVNADGSGSGRASQRQLLLHVEDVEIFDGAPMEFQFLSDIGHGRRTTTSSHGQHEPLGVAWVGCQPGKLLPLHAAPRPEHATMRELQIDVATAAIQVARLSELAIVGATNLACA